MSAELSYHGHGDTGGRVTLPHHAAEDGATGEQQEKPDELLAALGDFFE
jgi:hypothetical protein